MRLRFESSLSYEQKTLDDNKMCNVYYVIMKIYEVNINFIKKILHLFTALLRFCLPCRMQPSCYDENMYYKYILLVHKTLAGLML